MKPEKSNRRHNIKVFGITVASVAAFVLISFSGLFFLFFFFFSFPAVHDSPSVVVYGGVEYGHEYSYSRHPFEVEGKLAYVANADSRKSNYDFLNRMYGVEEDFIVFDGSPVNGYWREAFRTYRVPYTVTIDGETVVNFRNRNINDIWDEVKCQSKVEKREKDNPHEEWFVVDGVEHKHYESIFGVNELNCKLFYSASLRHEGMTMYTDVYDGLEVDFKHLIIVDDEFTHVSVEYDSDGNNAQYYIVHGVEEGLRYDSICDFVDFNGKVAYAAHRNGKLFIVVDGVEEEQEWDYGGPGGRYWCKPGGRGLGNGLFVVEDKLAYHAEGRRDDGHFYEFIVLDGVAQKGYRGIRDITLINGKVAYTAEFYREEFT
jgi:hypothetical protein